MREIRLDNILVTHNSKPYVIAEIGHNHTGNVFMCKEMIKQAKLAGTNAVKLQKRNNKTLFTEELYNKSYDNENSYGKTYGKHREFLEFDFDEYIDLMNFAKRQNITFFATPFDKDSVDFLETINVPFYKIQSGDVTNLELIEYICKKNKPIILSTGGSTWNEIERAVDIIEIYGNDLAILHCVSLYPARAENINLNLIYEMKNEFENHIIGFSSHYDGVLASIGAYMMGAQIIEQHFTLSHAYKGTDHALSLQPAGLQELVHYLNELYEMRQGNAKDFKQLGDEKMAISKLAKSMYFSRDIKKGERIFYNDIDVKIPWNADGMPIHELYKNKEGIKTNKEYKKNDLVLNILIGGNMIRECDNQQNSERIEPLSKYEIKDKKSPVELQREMLNKESSPKLIRKETLQEVRDHEKENYNSTEKIAAVAAIEGNLPYFCFFDDGKQVNVNSNGFSKPALLGLLITFVEKFKKELV